MGWILVCGLPVCNCRIRRSEDSVGPVPPLARCTNRRYVVLRRTVPIQTRYPPRNVRFEIADVTERLRFADGSVDVVHARMASLRVRSCLSYWSFLNDVGYQPEVVPHFLQEVARVLRPGGIFLNADWGVQPILHPEQQVFVNDDANIPQTVSFYQAASCVSIL